jgi:hypothetical protein
MAVFDGQTWRIARASWREARCLASADSCCLSLFDGQTPSSTFFWLLLSWGPAVGPGLGMKGGGAYGLTHLILMGYTHLVQHA